MVASLSNGHSEEKFGKPLMENGDCTFLVLPKYKRRRVSVIRDFPEGCGLFGSKIHPQTIFQTFDLSLTKEDPVVSSHMHGPPPLANDEPSNEQLVGMEAALEDTELTRTPKAVKSGSISMSNLPPTVNEVAFVGVSKFLSSDCNMSCSSSCLKNAVTARSFPRRKVSAVRGFPPLCGKNASHLRFDSECLNEISSLGNKSNGLQNMFVDDKPLEKVTATDAKEVMGIVRAENQGDDATTNVKTLDVFESSSTMQLAPESVRERCITIFEESSHHQVELNSKAEDIDGNGDAVQFEGRSGNEILVLPEFQSHETEPSEMPNCRHEPKGGFDGLQVVSIKTVVLGLMAESKCPWRHGKDSSKFDLIDGTNLSKRKKVGIFAQHDMSKADKREESPNHVGKKPSQKKKQNAASEGSGQLVIWENNDSHNCNENIGEFRVNEKSNGSSVQVPPISHHNNDSNVTRNKVRETLRYFHAVYRKLLHEDESKIKMQTDGPRIFHTRAAKILKEQGKYINTGKQILGSVPGVEVGDEFQFRLELNIVGLHRQVQGGIDYVDHNGKILATSVVATGGHADELDNPDVLIYTGQGGNLVNSDKEPEDQKLKRGNLALKNSSEEKNPVRVIRGSESTDGKLRRYVYDGHYIVDRYWQDMGPHGKLIFRFLLQRIPGQPVLAWKEVEKSKKMKLGEGLRVNDISHGKERIPICAVNTIDNEKPPPFKYTTSMIYPNWCNPIPPEGCDCIDGCSDSEKCFCAVKNGGEIPFNHNGAIVEAKSLVYECGPSCKCTSCYNRVSQLGIKLQLEIFKTKTRGWGVRSINFISSGTFICEYTGELLEEKDAEQRTGTDEYLFDIGNNYNNYTSLDGPLNVIQDTQSTSCKVVEGNSFTIDAAEYGNLGRFINHSCSPNLYAQNVLHDHDDERIPHIMLFAADNIPPFQELTYDYNYKIDQVFDSNGKIKRKNCYCGSVECTGRMY
ncbi:hypothetical protein Lal_00026552 [Lupinus albus]|uniref:Putative histone-lysine N-methyltransferase chromatin remodeling SET family n=1 Tax=Lupinus albus TaxID=3870 RepID=A0A6A5LSS2_LUPAL|nr:putative histone-lysine N-methyltransferase chromatin remodeling SET family [Lupinus albus]KAF1862035.1 hypothetical protein Lal_00026552 [Lupinus albus]